ncbi:hypothetical protein [Antrihabitans stalactiti]|jgi:Lon protease-like protein|uniref:PIN domain-containing protein n=1 Tax=Antrihabitans stalactiti TaxID=2584121 RepID=A0A848KM02_9NOCA|nr:hypothetical protein [Antrihabitans stalactiti]NMN99279.1 hypothetical protein [Antrihabitans stalactiti]
MTTARRAVDNDVIIKMSCYRLLSELTALSDGAYSVGILGAARFVVRQVLARKFGIEDRAAALVEFTTFLADVEELEPTASEIDLATELEELANRQSVGLDLGESQLCAIVITRGFETLITGDKRAIQAAEELKVFCPALESLAGRVVCLEQVIVGISNATGYGTSRSKVCAERAVDTALSICFSCWNPSLPDDATVARAFRSYIQNLRNAAPTLLHPGDSFPSS